jgi:hypothetical protein
VAELVEALVLLGRVVDQQHHQLELAVAVGHGDPLGAV